MPYIELGESRIYYEVHGDGPPLVFAHGVGGNHASWFRQVPVFRKSHKVIVFDHRDFGNSTDAEGVGCGAYVDDLLALLDEIEAEKAVLVGQSMGGGTVASFTCSYPERVHGVVIADSLAGIDAPEPLASQIAAVHKANANLTQEQRVLGPVMRGDDLSQTLLYLQLASFNKVNVKTVKGKIPPWRPDQLSSAGLPTLFLVGEHDILFKPSAIEEVHKLVPHSEFELLHGAGHSAYFERPVAFNTRLEKFLDDIGPY